MTASQPNILVPREGEARLLWAIVVSGVVHAAAIVAVIIVPRYWEGRPAPSVSYTVDLVASADTAGTNLPAGRSDLKRLGAAAAPPAVAKPPAPAAEPAAPVPEAKPLEPAAEVGPPPEAPPQPPKPQVPAPEAPPKPDPASAEKAELKLGSKTAKPTAMKVKPTVAVAQATAPAAKPTAVAPKPTAVVAQKPTAISVSKPTVAAAPKPTAVVAQKPTPAAAQTAAAVVSSEADAREKQIAAAVQRRIADQKIADAVQRRAAAAGQGATAGGAEGTAPGGPVSVGQGTGSGGVVEGLEMILYRGQMERRIKENWVWAGDDLKLEVKVLFDVTPTGEIQNVRVTGSSGNRSYDASAERAVRAASPLPPPPEKYRELFVRGVELTFSPQDLQQ